MTLARKTILSLGALTAVLLLATSAAIWELVALQELTNSTRDKFDELREVRQLEHHLAAVSQALADGRRGQADEELAGAIDHLDDFEELQRGESGRAELTSESQEQRRAVRARAALSELHAALAVNAGDPSPARPEEFQLVQNAQRCLAGLVDEFEQAVSRTDATTAARFRETLIAMATLAGVVLVAAMSVSLRHYRSVVGPLLQLRNSARRLAGGDLAARMKLDGDAEFVDLKGDFNTMAAELQSLYENLERRVAEQGRQLAVSERLASVGFLAAGVAHEINNPLAIMSAHLESLLRRVRESRCDRDSAEMVADLAIVRDEVFRCSRITRALLDLSRAGDQQRTPISIWSVLENVAHLIRMAPQCDGVAVEMDGDRQDRLLVSASELELRQVLLNLAMNAAQAVTPPAGRIELVAQRNNGWIEVQVRDNGGGMSAEILERVFEPFFTTRRGQSGMGLGLAVSHAIVRRHHGELTATSRGAGCGSTFTLRLPQFPEDSS